VARLCPAEPGGGQWRRARLYRGGPPRYQKWKGYGHQRQTIANAKLVVPVGKAELSGYVSYSDRREVDYQDLSLDMLNRLGYKWDNISSNYALAVKVADVAANNGYSGATATNPSAGTAWPAPFANADDAYYSGGGLRKDTLAWVGAKSALGGTFTGEVKAYYHHNDGRGLWWTPYVNSPNGIPLSLRTTEYKIDRGGLFGCLGRSGRAQADVGGWWNTTASTRPAAIMRWPAAPIRSGPARLADQPVCHAMGIQLQDRNPAILCAGHGESWAL
jgi:iron complex outermembrane receptor protein